MFTYFLGIGNAEYRYVIWGMRRDFITWILPIIVSCLPDQDFIIDFIFSILRSQFWVNISVLFLLNIIPSVLIDLQFHLILSKSSGISQFFPNWNPYDFSRLSTRPEREPNISIMFKALLDLF